MSETRFNVGVHYEWRAVFSYPDSTLGKTSDSYGPPRKTANETLSDMPYRSEESHGWRSGTQRRKVTDWEDQIATDDTPTT